MPTPRQKKLIQLDEKKNGSQDNPKESKLKKGYYFATYLLAFIAIIGFIWSIISSNQTSKTLEKLDKGLNSFLEPILVFGDYVWLGDKPLNCENPPNGINLLYKNASNIPIRFLNYDLISYYGDYKINQSELNHDPADKLISSGEVFGMTIIFGNAKIQDMMKNKTNVLHAPFFRFDLTAIISTLDGSKKYKINLINDCGVDCNAYNVRNITTVKSSYVSVVDK